MLRVGLVSGGVVPLMHDEPLPRRSFILRETLRDEAREFFERHRLAVEIAHVQVDDIDGMDVAVDQARQYQAAAETLRPGLWADPAARIGRAADEDEFSVFYREGGRHGASGIYGVDLAVG
jgi:hypothetical protein